MKSKISFLWVSCLVFCTTVFAQNTWKKLENAPTYKGKQDDIFFLNDTLGWYVNGAGKIYKTYDGGESWAEKINKPGTYFRCIGFSDSLNGFAGNIGTDYFPGVTDTLPLYQTKDGGTTWNAIQNVKGPQVKGLCAIEIVYKKFINAGVLDYKPIIYAGGRVGGPAFLMKSNDLGKTWFSQDMSAYCNMILDIKFVSADTGFVFAGSDAEVEKSNGKILYTVDGGKNWKAVYQSNRPYELMWKGTFASRKVAYATLQNYNPDSTITQRYVVKSFDGGLHWQEIPLVNDFKCTEFGVAFADEKLGWVGARKTGYETQDGGLSWKETEMGKAVNKIRILKSGKKICGYAIGSNVYKLEIDK
ncbi:MAG: hypothetical protein IPP32_06735 [Bacteroidetes bacterium]|nr:hypothetical protein [Bacteroidota bacterium]